MGVCWVCGVELKTEDSVLSCPECTHPDGTGDVGALLDDLLEEPLEAVELD